MEKYLHSGYGSCILRQAAPAEIVENALKHYARSRYHLGDYVIMPNHVHAVLLPINEAKLENIMMTLKSFTSNAINRKLHTSGSIWFSETYDHIIRHETELARIVNYVRANPEKAGLKKTQIPTGGSTEDWECIPPEYYQ